MRVNHEAFSKARPARGQGRPLVAIPLMQGLVKKKSKVDKNSNFLQARFLNVLDDSELIETNFFYKKNFPTPPPPWPGGG